jgi:hypothetical protein
VISYSLACARGHQFEGWFQNSAAYDEQEANGDLCCPACGDASVRKAIMAPSVKTSTTKAKGRDEITPADAKALRQYATGVRKFVEQNAEYVGPRFAEEARKIHYGESEQKHIYGESTLAEAKELIAEGIDVAPLPPDPDDLN